MATGEGRALNLQTRLTGQPVIGAAFAESETRSLFESTLVSVVGLALTLLVARQLRALIPALWTLCVTMGLLALLGLPISVGTSMISCIAIGAGVDFAIHLGFRARSFSGPDRGQRAVDEIGVVTLISALQLACAFAVLLASELAPLREFGIGLAIGLVGAARVDSRHVQRLAACRSLRRRPPEAPWRRSVRFRGVRSRPLSQCDADHQMAHTG